MIKLDKKDHEILNVLKHNAKWTTQQICKKTGIPITTIHNRIRKMEHEGVIKGYTTILDYKKIDRGIAAYVLITIDYRKHHLLIETLRKNSLVENAEALAGPNDIMIKIRVSNTEELENFVLKYLQELGGVIKTQTLLILSENGNSK